MVLSSVMQCGMGSLWLERQRHTPVASTAKTCNRTGSGLELRHLDAQTVAVGSTIPYSGTL